MNQGEYAFENAVMMLRAGRRPEAMDLLTAALVDNPNNADCWSLRARLEAEAGRAFNAMLHHGFATQLAPNRQDLWVNRGIDAMTARMFKESRDSFERALKLGESYEAHYNYGNLLSSVMKVEEAVDHFRKAEAIGGVHNAQIYANLGTALIAKGEWHEGFQFFRQRFNAPGFPPRPRFDYPIWHGEPLDGKTILLYVEQGFGDEILSLRFASVIKEAGARVILSVRPPMFRLARSINEGRAAADAVILQYDPVPWTPDYMCALLDVPAWIDFAPERGLPLSQGYLKAEDRNYRLNFPPGKLKVGICWASGNRAFQPETLETAKAKTLKLEEFLFLKREDVFLVSLQKDHGDKYHLRDHGIRDPMMGVVDFADTAFIIDHLDLVITVDTSVAHLAGALGKTVWNLTRFDAMWPWMQETGKTCWYDSMMLYRQQAPFVWSHPLTRLRADFEDFYARKAAAA